MPPRDYDEEIEEEHLEGLHFDDPDPYCPLCELDEYQPWSDPVASVLEPLDFRIWEDFLCVQSVFVTI